MLIPMLDDEEDEAIEHSVQYLSAPRYRGTRDQGNVETDELRGRFPMSQDSKLGQTKSYVVNRPVSGVLGYFASHNFIVTHARYPGDPNAQVYSFGKSGEMISSKAGRVSFRTKGFSAKSHETDLKTWWATTDKSENFLAIPAPCGLVEAHARKVNKHKSYSLIPFLTKNSGNCNSITAGVAISAAGEGSDDFRKRLHDFLQQKRWSSGAESPHMDFHEREMLERIRSQPPRSADEQTKVDTLLRKSMRDLDDVWSEKDIRCFEEQKSKKGPPKC